MRDNKVDALKAELHAIDLWDRAAEKAAPDNQIIRAGCAARRTRRLEIICKIDALLSQTSN